MPARPTGAPRTGTAAHTWLCISSASFTKGQLHNLHAASFRATCATNGHLKLPILTNLTWRLTTKQATRAARDACLLTTGLTRPMPMAP